MSEYMCSQCGKKYGRREYDALERVPIDPDEDDPMNGRGYEKVCGECGSTFHTDKWSLRETVERDGEEITVSTVGLLIPHGRNHDQWFETGLFHDSGSQIVDRYGSKEGAKEGHKRILERVENGEYNFKPTGKRLVLGGGENDVE